MAGVLLLFSLLKAELPVSPKLISESFIPKILRKGVYTSYSCVYESEVLFNHLEVKIYYLT